MNVQALRDLEEPEAVAARRGLPVEDVAPHALLVSESAGIAEAKAAAEADAADGVTV